MSGTTTIPANRSEPRSVNRPQFPEPTGIEARRLKGLPQAVPRREAEAQTSSGVKSDAPRGKVRKPGGAAPELPGVEPRRRRQQRRVPGRQRGRLRTPGRSRAGDGGVSASVKTTDRLGQAQVLGLPDEVQHVSPKPQPKQYHRSESAYTVKLPSASSWKGQTPWRTRPRPLSLTPDASTVSPRG